MARAARAILTVVVAFATALTGCGGDESGTASGEDPGPAVAEVTGVSVVPVPSARHVTGEVDYPTSPPAGGDHNSVWQNCGFYTAEVVPELAVHSLEHGAVWITYRPDVADDVRDGLRELADQSDYVLVSPYRDNPAPIVLTAWGRQAGVDSLGDPVVGTFLDTYLEDGPSTPEPGAPCDGAVGVPPDQPTSLVG